VQQLQRDIPPQLLILGEVHVGHPARAEPRDDLVPTVDQRAVAISVTAPPPAGSAGRLRDRCGDRAAEAALGALNSDRDRDPRVLHRRVCDEPRLSQVRACVPTCECRSSRRR